MNNYDPLIKEFMTLQPQTIEGKETVGTAKEVMSLYGIRHLPIMNKENVVGIMSERDVNLALGIEGVDPQGLLVTDIVHKKPYIVNSQTPLREVVGEMAEKYYDATIVMDNGKLAGIFTAVDACRALHNLITEALEEENLDSIRHFKFFVLSRYMKDRSTAQA